jgi:excisionase family DNA binding protein
MRGVDMDKEKESTLTVLLKASEVAARLQVSRALAYRLMQTNQIPVVRINKAVRVRACDLEEYISKSWSGWK